MHRITTQTARSIHLVRVAEFRAPLADNVNQRRVEAACPPACKTAHNHESKHTRAAIIEEALKAQGGIEKGGKQRMA